jgi:hypothetical protein
MRHAAAQIRFSLHRAVGSRDERWRGEGGGVHCDTGGGGGGVHCAAGGGCGGIECGAAAGGGRGGVPRHDQALARGRRSRGPPRGWWQRRSARRCRRRLR